MLPSFAVLHCAVLKSIRNHRLAECHLELFDVDRADAVALSGMKLRRETAYTRAARRNEQRE